MNVAELKFEPRSISQQQSRSHGIWRGTGSCELMDQNVLQFPNILLSTSTPKVSTVSASLQLYSLSVLKTSHVFERDPHISRKKWDGASEERDLSSPFHFASRSQMACAIFILGFQTTC